MKTAIAYAVALAAVFTFGTMSTVAVAQTEIKVPLETPATHIKTRTAIVFKEALEKMSGGKYKVTLYPSTQLMSGKDEVPAVARNGDKFLSALLFLGARRKGIGVPTRRNPDGIRPEEALTSTCLRRPQREHRNRSTDGRHSHGGQDRSNKRRLVDVSDEWELLDRFKQRPDG